MFHFPDTKIISLLFFDFEVKLLLALFIVGLPLCIDSIIIPDNKETKLSEILLEAFDIASVVLEILDFVFESKVCLCCC